MSVSMEGLSVETGRNKTKTGQTFQYLSRLAKCSGNLVLNLPIRAAQSLNTHYQRGAPPTRGSKQNSSLLLETCPHRNNRTREQTPQQRRVFTQEHIPNYYYHGQTLEPARNIKC
jgi:hypothetical protein